MGQPSRAPTRDIARVDDAHARLLGLLVRELDDAGVAKPSALPGWTIGHVLSHVARNADSHRRRADGAAGGKAVDQYPGGVEGRASEIEAGAARSSAELIDDVRVSADRLRWAWADVPGEAWSLSTRDVAGTQRPLSQLPARRWHELEVHTADLRLGPTYRDWSSEFVSVWLPRHRSSASRRLPDDEQLPSASAFDDERDELAWLLGRINRPDLPPLTPWG